MNIKNLLITLIFSSSVFAFGQSNSYKAESEKIHDLIHTKLNIHFDIPNSELKGEAWITAMTHFNATDKIIFDAKRMVIHNVTMNNKKLEYNYFENKELIIELDRVYKKNEEFTIYIKYTSRPEKIFGSNVTDSVDKKGLYFIDPRGVDPNKPTQIWTEGETESNSVWFPTIDSPNQKSTQEISITVPQNFVTLSNGTLISETENPDGTRTDYWKQNQKHAPYLFFIAAGEFRVIKDTWNGKPIEYFVEKEYEHSAKAIFGKTPEMLTFYEDLLGVEYPWDKYSQIVVRDYISGAMENTTAVLHSDRAYQDAGELIDENKWEATIAHEIFHHWFGNIVTAESWSNLALNESFANYGEYLWFEHAYGKDYADETLIKSRNLYFDSDKKNELKNLIRFKYETTDDLFDRVSYDKGGLILHMLRNYLGDDQFFAGLKKYLIDNSFGTVEAHQLRLAFEAISGKDLNPFFNQWFFGSGHPNLFITHEVGGFNDVVTVNVNQAGKVFEFPLAIDIYEKDGRKSTYTVWVDNRSNSFTFSVSSKPKLVNINPAGILLGEIAHSKTLEETIYQYNHAVEYFARKEALIQLLQHQDNRLAFKTITKALNDSSFHLRIIALEKLDLVNKHLKEEAIKIVENLAENDPKTLVQSAANLTLAKLVDPSYINHFTDALNSKSYKVIESAVIGLYQLDKENTLEKIATLSEGAKDNMGALLTGYYIEDKDEKYMSFIANHVTRGLFFVQSKKVADLYMDAFEWISRSDNEQAISNLVDSFVAMGIKYKKDKGDMAAINFLRQMQFLQKESNHTNIKELKNIIRKGMAKLID